MDLTSRELLVASLMRLACSAAATAPSATQQQQPQGPDGATPQQQPQAQAPSAALLHQLLLPRVHAARSALERLSEALASTAASGSLSSYVPFAAANGAAAAAAQDAAAAAAAAAGVMVGGGSGGRCCCSKEPEEKGTVTVAVGGGGRGRPAAGGPPSLSASSAPVELQQLGAAVHTAAACVGGLASMLMFVPAAGQVHDMGSGSAGSGKRSGGAGPAGAQQQSADAAAAAAGAAAVAVAAAAAIGAVWPSLAACIAHGQQQQQQPAQEAGPAGGGSGSGSTSSSNSASGNSSPSSNLLMLSTAEGAALLRSACFLVQGGLLIASAVPGATGTSPATQASTQRIQPPTVQPPATNPQLLQNASDLLSAAVSVLQAAEARQQLVVQQQQQRQQQQQQHLVQVFPAAGADGAAAAAGSHAWPSAGVLSLAAGCLPLCRPALLSGHQGGDMRAAAVAEQAVQAACTAVLRACNGLKVRHRTLPS